MPCGEPGPVFALVNASTDATLAASYFITQAYGRREDVGRDTSFAPELSCRGDSQGARAQGSVWCISDWVPGGEGR